MPIATAVNTEQYALKLSTSPDVCTRTHYFVFLRDIIETVTSQNFQQKKLDRSNKLVWIRIFFCLFC